MMRADLAAGTLAVAVLIAVLLWPVAPPSPAEAAGTASPLPDALRIATLNADLSRSGPGLLLRDITSASDPQVEATAALVAHLGPDVLLLTKFDYDHGGAALAAFAARVAAHGHDLPHAFALRPNTGQATGLDLDGDGRIGRAGDAQGRGDFAGQAGMAILSRWPVEAEAVRDFSALLWADLPGHRMPPATPEAVRAVQRLSFTGHWDVPLRLPDGSRLHLLAFHATPPVPDDRARRRNADEVRFWSLLLDGALPWPPPAGPFVLLGDANLDPADGDGDGAVMADLLRHPALQDPAQASPGGAVAGGGPDHEGDPARDTAAWSWEGGPGNLRVDYVLPSAGLRLRDAGVFWPAPDDPQRALLAEDVEGMTRHRLVWVDIAPPRPP